MSNFISFDKIDRSHMKAQTAKPNPNGKGKTAWLDYTEGPTRSAKFATPKELRQMWPIRPSGEDNQKFNLEIELGSEAEAFLKKCNLFDDFVLETAFQNRKEWFGNNSAKLTSVNDMRITYNKLTVDGKENRNGGKYPDSIRFKIEGKWNEYLKEVLYREDSTMPRDTLWNPRIVNPLDSASEVKDNETQFFLFMSKDPVSGVDNYHDRVPVNDTAGHQLKDKDGNGIWRYVGPQDCRQNSRVTVVFTANRVWISDMRFGVTLSAKKIYIKPPPPKVSQTLEGVRVLTSVDVTVASRAVLAANANTGDDDDDEEDGHVRNTGVPAAMEVETAPATTLSSGIDETPRKKSRKTGTKTITLEDQV
jgi:hypothetical protein